MTLQSPWQIPGLTSAIYLLCAHCCENSIYYHKSKKRFCCDHAQRRRRRRRRPRCFRVVGQDGTAAVMMTGDGSSDLLPVMFVRGQIKMYPRRGRRANDSSNSSARGSMSSGRLHARVSFRRIKRFRFFFFSKSFSFSRVVETGWPGTTTRGIASIRLYRVHATLLGVRLMKKKKKRCLSPVHWQFIVIQLSRWRVI